MSLPPAKELRDLAKLFDYAPVKNADFEPFNSAKEKLLKYSKTLAITAAQSAIQHGVTVVSGAAVTMVGVGVGSIALFPLGAALGPWFVAAAVASKASGIFKLYDLKDSAAGNGDFAYSCTCGNCEKNLTYVIDRKETNFAIMAVGAATGGLAIIVDRLNSVRKSFQKNRPKEQICRSIVLGARGKCICAIATIMMLCGGWNNDEKKDRELTVETVAIIFSSDGHDRLKSKW